MLGGVLTFAVAFAASCGLTVPIRRVALHWGIVDVPNARKIHRVPRLGGRYHNGWVVDARRDQTRRENLTGRRARNPGAHRPGPNRRSNVQSLLHAGQYPALAVLAARLSHLAKHPQGHGY